MLGIPPFKQQINIEQHEKSLTLYASLIYSLTSNLKSTINWAQDTCNCDQIQTNRLNNRWRRWFQYTINFNLLNWDMKCHASGSIFKKWLLVGQVFIFYSFFYYTVNLYYLSRKLIYGNRFFSLKWHIFCSNSTNFHWYFSSWYISFQRTALNDK